LTRAGWAATWFFVELKPLATAVLAVLLMPALLHAQSSPSPSPSVAAPAIAASNLPVVQAPDLIPLLPAAPAGWSADKPEGSTSDSTGFEITTVGNVYVDGTADNAPTAAINIIDSANNQQFQEATKAMWAATSDTPEGYDKTVTVDGLPGFEHFANADQTGVLWVVAGGRFFVQVETTHLPASELQTWLDRIDLKKLSTLK
jgi:hypothetical protein